MATLTTISEKEILLAAWKDRLNRWLRRIDENERSLEERGKESQIAKHWIQVYKSQLDELEAAIKALEDAE